MKKAFCGLWTAALVMPLVVGAVTWTGDSNQFMWSSTSTVYNNYLKASQIVLQCIPDVAKGIVTIQYKFPSVAKNVKLNIYNVSGVLIQNFALQSGSSAVQWDYTKNNVAAGIYVASLRYGDVEKNIQLSLVK